MEKKKVIQNVKWIIPISKANSGRFDKVRLLVLKVFIIPIYPSPPLMPYKRSGIPWWVQPIENTPFSEYRLLSLRLLLLVVLKLLSTTLWTKHYSSIFLFVTLNWPLIVCATDDSLKKVKNIAFSIVLCTCHNKFT